MKADTDTLMPCQHLSKWQRPKFWLLLNSGVFLIEFHFLEQLAIPYLGCLFNFTVMPDYKCK